jgi:hypothetical protein
MFGHHLNNTLVEMLTRNRQGTPLGSFFCFPLSSDGGKSGRCDAMDVCMYAQEVNRVTFPPNTRNMGEAGLEERVEEA